MSHCPTSSAELLSLQYVAGFFDGEGTISISLSMTTSRAGTVRPHHSLCVRLGQTKLGILERLKAQFGGGITTYKPQPRKAQAWAWVLCARGALAFLEQVAPHLILKKAEAEVAFEFAKLMDKMVPAKGQPRGSLRVSEEVIQARESLRVRLVGMHAASGAARFQTLESRGPYVS
jgi:hypothetical protein